MMTENEREFIPGAFNPLSMELTQCLVNSSKSTTLLSDEPDKKLTCVGTHNDIQDFHLLSLPPRFTTVRVNFMQKTLTEAKLLVEEEIKRQFQGDSNVPTVYQHHSLPDLLVLESCGIESVLPAKKEVIIGKMCGSAVLRGAEVYAPGVIGVTPTLLAGECVAVYVDLDEKCLRGSKKFGGRKLFVGNGLLMQSRRDLFGKKKPTGVAVSMTEPIFKLPSLGNFCQDFLFLQNLPSALCSHILGAPENSIVLDMCAAPGGKSTHIASLMKGTGCVIAIDRSQNKIDQIKANADKLALKNIVCVKYDSTLLLNEKSDEDENTQMFIMDDQGCGGEINSYFLPPYKPSSFKWILLDAPCSALGQRPQLHNKMSQNEIKSFPVIQRKLLSTGLKLLAPGGKLVYSTCTIVPEENEKMVKWVLDNNAGIDLLDSEPKLGMPGLPNCGLTMEQSNKMQRFNPNCMILSEPSVDKDTIGFFIASFVKKEL